MVIVTGLLYRIAPSFALCFGGMLQIISDIVTVTKAEASRNSGAASAAARPLIVVRRF